jgi:glycosyltransferase involved in cell wall biosynthesis
MTSTKPLVSVIMATHIIDDFLEDSIKSILNQTYLNIEFIIVANGAEYETIYLHILDIIKECDAKNVIVLKTPIAQLGFALNLCISECNGLLIARMDADDISHPTRITEQVMYLLTNNLDMVGSQLRLINTQGTAIGIQQYPLTASQIYKLLPFKNCFAHNTILIRKSILLNARGYCGGFNTEDYDLWLRLRKSNIKWANMNEFHVDYRIHDAATRRKILSYAEACGLIARELCCTFNPVYLFAFITHVARLLLRAKR